VQGMLLIVTDGFIPYECHLVCKTLLKLDKMMATTLRPDRSPSHHVCSLFTELPNLHWRDIVDNLHCEYC
jgi:hypothetical protein